MESSLANMLHKICTLLLLLSCLFLPGRGQGQIHIELESLSKHVERGQEAHRMLDTSDGEVVLNLVLITESGEKKYTGLRRLSSTCPISPNIVVTVISEEIEEVNSETPYRCSAYSNAEYSIVVRINKEKEVSGLLADKTDGVFVQFHSIDSVEFSVTEEEGGRLVLGTGAILVEDLNEIGQDDDAYPCGNGMENPVFEWGMNLTESVRIPSSEAEEETGENGVMDYVSSDSARWVNCYPGDETPHTLRIGVAIGSEMSKWLGNSNDEVLNFLEDTIAYINIVYSRQLNIYLEVDELIILKGNNNQQSWDNPGCKLSIFEQFNEWKRGNLMNSKPKGLWHMIDNCFKKGDPIGVAYNSPNSLCSGFGYGLSYHSRNTWLTFAHEVGHNFGASHSFEEGQGKTGGIMDYGDKKLDGIYQFNTKYRKDQICKQITDSMSECETHFLPLVISETCGNKFLDIGEECECPDGGRNCECCMDCKLKEAAECSSFLNECCTDDCKFKPADSANTCTTIDGVSGGYCSHGHCTNSCQSWSPYVGKPCGIQEGNPCRFKCMRGQTCNNMNGWTYSPDGETNIDINMVNDKTKCFVPDTGAEGICISGYCEEKKGSLTSQPPTKSPTLQPTSYPTKYITDQPTTQPTVQPTEFPSKHLTLYPTAQPNTTEPIKVGVTRIPTFHPTNYPTPQPITPQPTSLPTLQLREFPTSKPTTRAPTVYPTNYPTAYPTSYPSRSPIFPTLFPTPRTNPRPSKSPTNLAAETQKPTIAPNSQVETLDKGLGNISENENSPGKMAVFSFFILGFLFAILVAICRRKHGKRYMSDVRNDVKPGNNGVGAVRGGHPFIRVSFDRLGWSASILRGTSVGNRNNDVQNQDELANTRHSNSTRRESFMESMVMSLRGKADKLYGALSKVSNNNTLNEEELETGNMRRRQTSISDKIHTIFSSRIPKTPKTDVESDYLRHESLNNEGFQNENIRQRKTSISDKIQAIFSIRSQKTPNAAVESDNVRRESFSEEGVGNENIRQRKISISDKIQAMFSTRNQKLQKTDMESGTLEKEFLSGEGLENETGSQKKTSNSYNGQDLCQKRKPEVSRVDALQNENENIVRDSKDEYDETSADEISLGSSTRNMEFDHQQPSDRKLSVMENIAASLAESGGNAQNSFFSAVSAVNGQLRSISSFVDRTALSSRETKSSTGEVMKESKTTNSFYMHKKNNQNINFVDNRSAGGDEGKQKLFNPSNMITTFPNRVKARIKNEKRVPTVLSSSMKDEKRDDSNKKHIVKENTVSVLTREYQQGIDNEMRKRKLARANAQKEVSMQRKCNGASSTDSHRLRSSSSNSVGSDMSVPELIEKFQSPNRQKKGSKVLDRKDKIESRQRSNSGKSTGSDVSVSLLKDKFESKHRNRRRSRSIRSNDSDSSVAELKDNIESLLPAGLGRHPIKRKQNGKRVSILKGKFEQTPPRRPRWKSSDANNSRPRPADSSSAYDV